VLTAFGVLKNTWQFLDRLILLYDLEVISHRVIFCLLLHNILVMDRVMQQDPDSYIYRERYDPSKGAFDTLNEVEQPAAIQVVQATPAGEATPLIGRINNAPLQCRPSPLEVKNLQN
jgi:hypothetical protein